MAENNNEKKIELEEGEIMRISVRDFNPENGSYKISFASNGNAGVMAEALKCILEEEFDLTCVPKGTMMGITICIPRYDEEDEEPEENAEESQE